MAQDVVNNGLRDESGNENSNGLSDEHNPRWNVHVMTHLHASKVGIGLFCGPRNVSLKDHMRNRLSGDDIPADEVRDERQLDPLVRHGSNDAHREYEQYWDDDGDNEGPYRESSGEDLDAGDTSSEAKDEEKAVPQHRYFWVSHHQA